MRASSSRNAALVALGIFLSRIIGFVRERLFAHYLGNSAAADAFKAALKIPNLLQNLFGEGALSASFIPVYSRLLVLGDEAEARRVARVVGTLLALTVSVLALVGVLATPFLIDAIAPGFTGEKREWTIRMVRILFPGVGVLVMSAWCLGILNSHRRFFLPYAAPVLWNGAMIAALWGWGGRRDGYALAEVVCWGATLGSVLQLGVQLPLVTRLAGSLRPQLALASENVRAVFRNFTPSVASRGVSQVSAYIDAVLASFMPTGAVAALAYAQTLYLLPVSLFGMSVSAAELPEMSSGVGTPDEVAAALRDRLNRALRRIAVFIVPSAMAFVALGDTVVAFLYQTGKFSRGDVTYVWGVVAGASVGLLANTMARLYASGHWALRDTRTPLHFAIVRVVLTTGLGWLLAFPVPRALGIPPRWGLVGLTASAGMAGWVEFVLLARALDRRVGKTGLPGPFVARLWGAAGLAAGAAFLVKLATASLHPLLAGVVVLSVYGALYFGLASAAGVEEATQTVRAVLRRAGLGGTRKKL